MANANKLQLARWSALVAGLWMLSNSGLSYNFAIYSSGLKESLQYSQARVALLGTAKDIGDNVGLLAGFLSPMLPTWALLLLGTMQNTAGYGMLYLIASKHLPQPPFWQVFFWMWLGVNGSTYFNTAVLVTCVRSFPKSRGVVVGLLKAMIGLSGAIYAQIYTALLAPDQVAFLGVLALGPAVMVLLVVAMLRPCPPPADDDEESEKEESRNLRFLFGVFLGMAAYLMADILLSSFFGLSRFQSQLVAVGMLLVPLLTLTVPLRVYFAQGKDRAPAPALPPVQETEPLLEGAAQAAPDVLVKLDPGSREPLESAISSAQAPESSLRVDPEEDSGGGRDGALDLGLQTLSEDEAELNLGAGNLADVHGIDTSGPARIARYEAGAASYSNLAALATSPQPEDEAQQLPVAPITSWVRKSRPRRGEDFTLPEGLVKADFWLLFAAILCGAGSGLTAINNLAQLGQAQGLEDIRIPVALVSIWNYLGRIIGGFYSEHLLRRHGFPRPVMLVGATAVMSLGHLLFAFAVPGSVYIGSWIVGSCFGIIMSMIPVIGSELFGLQNFGLFYNVFTSAIPMGSYIFSGVIAGYLYDREVEKSGGDGLGVPVTGLPSIQQVLFAVSHVHGGEVTSVSQGFTPGNTLSLQSTKEMIDMNNNDLPAFGLFGLSGEKLGSHHNLGANLLRRVEENKVCRGAHCFQLTFILMALVSLVGTLVSTILMTRTRPVYRRLYRRKSKTREQLKDNLRSK